MLRDLAAFPKSCEGRHVRGDILPLFEPARIHNAISLYIVLFFVGLAVSVFGSIVGLGGGFVLVPLLRLFFGLPPAIIAGTSLALVVTNNAAASLSYLRQRRVDVRTGLLIAAGGLPGSILGASSVRTMSVHLFDWLLAILTLAVAADILVNGYSRLSRRPPHGTVTMKWYSAVILGVAVGLLSGLFGAGGGILLISALFYFTELSAHEVTATTQFSILFVAAIGLAAHYLQHDLRLTYALPLILGGLVGGPIGARVSSHLKPRRLMSLVAVALIIAAAALVARDLLP
ncbi:MAG: sulfite exporter TauE/SafE family protein [Candidatus Tumulicola sp.]